MAKSKKQKLADVDAAKIKPGTVIESKTTGNCGKITSIKINQENKWHSETVVEWEWGGYSTICYGMLENFSIKQSA